MSAIPHNPDHMSVSVLMILEIFYLADDRRMLSSYFGPMMGINGS